MGLNIARWCRRYGPSICGLAIAVTGPMACAYGEGAEALDRRLALINPTSLIADSDYPKSALNANVQGTVQAELTVNASGLPIVCKVAISSGSALLDTTTCDLLKRRARYRVLATEQRQGDLYTTHQTVSWQIPGAPAAEHNRSPAPPNGSGSIGTMIGLAVCGTLAGLAGALLLPNSAMQRTRDTPASRIMLQAFVFFAR